MPERWDVLDFQAPVDPEVSVALQVLRDPLDQLVTGVYPEHVVSQDPPAPPDLRAVTETTERGVHADLQEAVARWEDRDLQDLWDL